MKALTIAVAFVLVLAVGTTACPAAGLDGSQTGQPDARGTVWAFPPAVEFVNATDGGHTSVEVGLMPALWHSGDDVDTDVGPRVGLFFYPTGGARGVAGYTGFTLATLELGLCYLWRSPRRGLSFRLGAGWVQSYDAAAGGDPGFGAAIGFTF